jgi:hypothetical protein
MPGFQIDEIYSYLSLLAVANFQKIEHHLMELELSLALLIPTGLATIDCNLLIYTCHDVINFIISQRVYFNNDSSWGRGVCYFITIKNAKLME